MKQQDNRSKATPLVKLEYISILIRSKLWLQIIIAMILGISVGLVLSPEGGGLLDLETSLVVAGWLKLPGSLFLNIIQMVVIPLVMSSIVLGIYSSGDPSYLKKVGLRLFPYFVATTTVAVTLGIILATLIAPGDMVDSQALQNVSTEVTSSPEVVMDSLPLPEKIANLIPRNIDEAKVIRDMLQIVIYAIFIGVALIALPKESTNVFVSFLRTAQDLSLKVVSWAMLLVPIAVFGLLADISVRIGIDAILSMSVYVGTVLMGLLLLLLFYLLLVLLLAKRSPVEFLKSIKEVQLLAFSTSSSAAVMPLSMEVAEKDLGVRPRIAKFIIPLGATINMDGTAIYQVIAALFLAQFYGIDLSILQIVVLAVTAVGASIGTPSTPGVGIVILATLLHTIGVPESGIALIIGVDRILDMCRTSVNVSGDLTACVVMNRWLEPELE